MAVPIPVIVPKLLPAGDTAVFTRIFSDYRSTDGWAYNIYFNGPAANLAEAGVGTTNGGFTITMAAADTAALAVGAYRYIERVSLAGEVRTVGNGVLELTDNLATAAAGVTQTHEEKTLAVIEAALTGRLTNDMQSYQIAGRSVTKIPIRDLLMLRNLYASKVAVQHNGGKLGVDYQVEFGDPTSSTRFLGWFPAAGRFPWQ